MTAPHAQYHRASSKIGRLRARAAEAAAIREALQDPHVIALREERWRTIVSSGLWISLILGLLFTMTNVQAFAVLADNLAAAKLDPGRPPLDSTSATWWAYWAIDPMLSSALVALLFAEQRTAPKSIFLNPTARIGKWVVLAAIYVANTGPYWYVQVPLAIFLHSLPVIGIAFVAEVIPDAQDKISQAIAQWEAEFRQRRAEDAAEKARLAQETQAGTDTERDNRIKDAETEAQIQVIRSRAGVAVAENAAAAVATRTGPTVSGPTIPGRSEPSSRTGLNGRAGPGYGAGPALPGAQSQTGLETAPEPVQTAPSDRTGKAAQTGPDRRSRTTGKAPSGRSAKKPSPRQRTDDDLLEDVKALAEQNDGKAPNQYQLKQALGIGNDRAARLLKQLDPVPAGEPASNGAAKAGRH